MSISIEKMDPEQLVKYRSELHNCLTLPAIKKVMEIINKTRDDLFAELFETKLPGNTDAERMNYFHETRGYVRGLSLLESTLNGEIASVEELFGRIKAQMKQAQEQPPDVVPGDYGRGGYNAKEII